MAIINIVVDTEMSSLDADIDGKKIQDIKEVRIYRTREYEQEEDSIEEKVKVEIVSRTEDEESDTCRLMITTCGSQIETKDALTSELIQALFPNKRV